MAHKTCKLTWICIPPSLLLLFRTFILNFIFHFVHFLGGSNLTRQTTLCAILHLLHLCTQVNTFKHGILKVGILISNSLEINLFANFFAQCSCLGELSSKSKNMAITYQHWIVVLAVLRQMFGHIDHPQQHHLLIPLSFYIIIIYHLFEQSWVPASVPFNKPLTLLYLFKYFA